MAPPRPHSDQHSDVVDHSRMFAAVPYEVLRELKHATAIALYAVLKMYAGADGKSHPSRMTLAECLGYKTRKPVDAAILELEKAGLVRSFPRFKDEEGNIGYGKDERFKEQTSNGYLIYDRIRPAESAPQPDDQVDPPVPHRVQPPQEKDTGLSPVGDGGYPLQGTGVIPCGVHEGDSMKEIQGRRGEGGHETSSTTPSWTASQPTASPPPDSIPDEWIDEPRRARCVDHTGVDAPPPCRGCGRAREQAQAAQHRRDTEKARQQAARRAAIDACDECNPFGFTNDGNGKLMRCAHAPYANDLIRDGLMGQAVKEARS